MKIGILDGNGQEIDFDSKDIAVGMPAQWLHWELQQAGIERYPATEADVIFYTFSSSLKFLSTSRKVFSEVGVEPLAEKRQGQPYVVVGGTVDATPFNALRVADAVGVGEGYRLVRKMLRCKTVDELKALLIADEHAIERSQIADVRWDDVRPWLLSEPAQQLARPDSWVDWSTPDVRGDDGITRVIGSKGCHLKCAFCSTTYRQEYAVRPIEDLKQRVEYWSDQRIEENGKMVKHRPQIVSNDPLNIPGFEQINGKLAFASVTLMELMNDDHFKTLMRSRPKLIRIGVEGVSERIRQYFGKPIKSRTLMDRMALSHEYGVNTKTFWIINAPYETAADWRGWFPQWQYFTDIVQKGIHRIKLTPFSPSPPAPLSRFICNPDKIIQQDAVDQLFWHLNYKDSKRRILIDGIPLAHTQHGIVHEQMQLRPGCYLPDFSALPKDERTIDLAPTAEDFSRLPSEIIDWPIKQSTRYRIGSIYKKRMLKE